MLKRIKANNFKILEFVDINPKKGVTFVFGPNEAGKSTMMDVLETTLVGGKKILNPIRDNQKKAETEIELDEYTIKKIFTEKSVRLEVYDKEGNKQAGGLKLIEKLINKIGFDPHEFTRLTPKDQRKMLMDLLKIDFTDLDKQRAEIFEERRDIGSQAKALPAYSQVEINEFIDKYEGKEEINIASLTEEVQKAYDEHQKYETIGQNLETINETVEQIDEQIKSLLARKEKLLKQKEEIINTPKPKSDLNDLKAQLSSAEETNQKIRKAKEMGENVHRAMQLSKQYSEKTKKIETIDTHKQNVLKNAQMPLDGLALTDECVTYNDRPFEQLSTSQKMKVSIAISLLLMDPEKEKIIMIREGNLLDDKSLDVVIEMAKEHNCYFFIEMVLDKNSEIPKQGILIQEGKVIAIDGEPVKK